MAKNLISQHNFTLYLFNSSLASSVIDSTAKLLILKIPIFKKTPIFPPLFSLFFTFFHQKNENSEGHKQRNILRQIKAFVK